MANGNGERRGGATLEVFIKLGVAVLIPIVGWVAVQLFGLTSRVARIEGDRYRIHEARQDFTQVNERIQSIERRLPTKFPPERYEKALDKRFTDIEKDIQDLQNRIP